VTAASSSSCTDAFVACSQAMQRAILIQCVSNSRSGKVTMANVQQVEEQLELTDDDASCSGEDDE